MKEKDVKHIIDNLIILIDSAEKNMPNHIAKTLDKYNIKWEVANLTSGDYSYYVPLIENINFEGIDFREEFAIERKSGISEISQNLAKYKARFHREFERFNGKIIIMIEKDSYYDMAVGNYDSKLTPKSLLGLLHSLSEKYESPFIFIDKDASPLYIYNTFKYHLRAKLKALKIT